MRIRAALPRALMLLALAPLVLVAQTRSPSGARLQVGSPPAGPPPQGITFASRATYGIFAQIKWNPAPNAVAYEVGRYFLSDPACCAVTSGPLPATATSWNDVGLSRVGTYMYTVTVRYQDGSVGTGGSTLVTQASPGPAPVTAEDLGPGRVRLTWGALPSCCVRIMGPGLGASGQQVVGGTSYDLFLPAGTHTWTLAPLYDPQQLPFPVATNYGTVSRAGTTYVILTPPSEWPQVSHTVDLRSGRYRLSLEQFRAIVPAAEDALRADGRGNEVYLLSQVNEYRNGAALASSRMIRTPTFGDVQNYPTRVQAGSLSPSGGIQAGDEYPATVQYVSQLRAPSTSDLPYLLWEGDLSEVDGAVILSPSIWEADEDPQMLPHFASFHASLAANAAYLNTLTNYIPRSGQPAAINTWNPVPCPSPMSGRGTSVFVPPAGAAWGDEPVDLASRQQYCPTFVAINWAVADAATRVNNAALLEIPFTGTPPWGQYRLVIRVEKVVPPTMAVPVRTVRKSVP